MDDCALLKLCTSDLDCFANDIKHMSQNERGAETRASFEIPAMQARSACGNYGDLVGAVHKPGKKNDTGNPEHCLGREAPAGLLNVIVHDVFSILETCAGGFRAVSPHPA